MRNKNENIAQQVVPPLIPMSFLAFFSIFPVSVVGPIPTPPSLVPLISHQKGRVSRAAGRWPPRIDGWRGTKQKPAPRTEPDPDGPDPHPRQRVDRSAGRAGQAGRQGRAGRQDRGGQGKAGQAGRQAGK